MDTIQNLRKYFEEFGCLVKDDGVLDKCIELCHFYDVDEERLVEMWLGYSTSTFNEVDVTLQRLTKMEQDLLKKKDKSTDISNSLKVLNTGDIPTESFRQMTESDNILEMYGCEGLIPSKTATGKRLRSPESSVDRQDGKIRAVEVTFSPSSYGAKLDLPARYPVNVDRGKVLLHFGKEISSWNRESSYDVEIGIFGEGVPVNPMYMFELLHSQAGMLVAVCRNVGERLCNIWAKSEKNMDVRYTKDVTVESQTTFRTWGRILCDSEMKSDLRSYMLEGCKWSYKDNRSAIVPLNLSGVKRYSLYPGQIVAVEGTNPTRSVLNVKQFFTKGYAVKPESHRLSKDINIMIAAGPFTSGDNLCYQPLFDLMEHVAKEEPHVLILVGPFVEDNHPEIKNVSIKETFQEHFERLVARVMQYLEGKPVKVVMIPSYKDAHHCPVFPTPQYVIAKDKLPQNGENLYMMPDPCLLDIEGLIIGITSIDSVKHIAKVEISNMSMDRLLRMADHILSQRCFYPSYPPSINLDTKLWKKYAFFDRQPHILILPSDMRYFCGVINDCLVVNPERSIKYTYARLRVRPSEQWNPHNVSCEIGKI